MVQNLRDGNGRWRGSCPSVLHLFLLGRPPVSVDDWHGGIGPIGVVGYGHLIVVEQGLLILLWYVVGLVVGPSMVGLSRGPKGTDQEHPYCCKLDKGKFNLLSTQNT